MSRSAHRTHPTLASVHAPGDLAEAKAALAALPGGGGQFGSHAGGLIHGGSRMQRSLAQAMAEPAARITEGRHILILPGRTWEHTPEHCTVPGTEWVAGGLVLMCTGCGVDCT